MINWIVGQMNCFKVVVIQCLILNWISFYGVSDIGYFFIDWQFEYDMFVDIEKFWDCFFLKYVVNVEILFLILYGE